MSIQTVSGKIGKDDLGIVSPHEHIFIDMKVFFTEPEEIEAKNHAYKKVTIDKLGILKRNPFAILDNVQVMDEDTQVEELMYFKYAGGKTMVDATTFGIGRSPELLCKVASRTGLHVITGAGYYVESSLPVSVLDKTVEEIETEIIEQLEKGIGHSGIRAGIIGEIGVSHIMYPFEKKSLIASCRAQKRTGAPLLIHINPWSTQGIQAMEIVNEYRITPEKVVICHSDVENNKDYIKTLLDQGVFIEFDNFGKEMATDLWDCKPGSGRFSTDWERVRLLKELIDEGYSKQLLLSCDICLKQLLHAYGGWGYDHVIVHILPMLKELGIKQEIIDQMIIHNPAIWLDIK
jgi:phosphotriesterase-related protein